MREHFLLSHHLCRWHGLCLLRKLYTKKAIYFCIEAWRRQFGDSVLQRHVVKTEEGEPVIFRREGLDDLVLTGWRKVCRLDKLMQENVFVYIGPQGQVCRDLHEAFEEYQGGQRNRRQPAHKLTFMQQLLKMHAVDEPVASSSTEGPVVVSNLQALQDTGEDEGVLVGVGQMKEGGYLSVTTSSLEDYLFRGDHPLLAGMSWATYGTWVYRVELPPRPEHSVRSSVPRFVDVYFDPAYKLYASHVQRISSEPRVPLFEGFTMPQLTVDSERNAMYKQLQCRPIRVKADPTVEQTMDELVLGAFAELSTPKHRKSTDPSVAAATAFTEAYLEWYKGIEADAAVARWRFAARYEYPSLWETQEIQDILEEKYGLAHEAALSSLPQDPDEHKPRVTSAMYSSMLAIDRIANLEGLARARQNRPKKRRDTDAYLQEEYVKVHTLGEAGEAGDGPEVLSEDEAGGAPKPPTEVFPPIVHRASEEERRRLLLLDYQGRKNALTKDFLKESWIQRDPFQIAEAARGNASDAVFRITQDLGALDAVPRFCAI